MLAKKDIADTVTTCAAGAKRVRDDGDKDPNSKKAKRPSPLPEKTAKQKRPSHHFLYASSSQPASLSFVASCILKVEKGCAS